MTRLAEDYSTGKPYYISADIDYKTWKASLSESQNKYFIADKKAREQYKSDVEQAREYKKLANKAEKMGYGDLVQGVDFKIKSFQEMKYYEPEKYETLKNNMKIIRNL